MSHNNVRTWMTPLPITISPEEPVLVAYERMKANHIRRLFVMEAQKLAGVITVGDIRSTLSMGRGSTLEPVDLNKDMKVASLMTSTPISITADESVGEAARLMMKHKVGGLAVLEKDKLIGVISEADLFRLLIAENWSAQTISGPSPNGEEIISLSNGKTVHIRPIRPDDAVHLQASLVQMSPETIYDRFMGYKKELPDQEARYLTSLDYDLHMALVAISEVNGEENIVGVARYHVMDKDASNAEFAIVISDSHQRQGLGSHLMKRLMEYAQMHGILTFVGFAHSENIRLLRFVQRSGLPIEKKLNAGIWEMYVNLKGVPFAKLKS